MKNWNRLALIVALAAVFLIRGNKGFAQGKMLYYNTVDSLSFGQRFSLRTNLASWVELTPNFGVEFTLGARNWSRWTLGLYGRANWKTKLQQDAPYNVYDMYDARLQLRKYWHERDPKNTGKKVRRSFYWGVYAGVNKFDVKFGYQGYRGNGYIGGLMVGTIQQLYGYKNGASLDLDLGLNGGVLFASKMETYHREHTADRLNTSYVVDKTENNTLVTKTLPMLASMDVLHVGLVYHFGTIVANRYKRRIDIDDAYRILLAEKKMRLDSLERVHRKQKAARRDSLAEVSYEKRFESQRKDIEEEYQKREAELIKQREQFLKEEKEAEERKKRAEEKAKAEAEEKAAKAKADEEEAQRKAEEAKKKAEQRAAARAAAANKKKK